MTGLVLQEGKRYVLKNGDVQVARRVHNSGDHPWKMNSIYYADDGVSNISHYGRYFPNFDVVSEYVEPSATPLVSESLARMHAAKMFASDVPVADDAKEELARAALGKVMDEVSPPAKTAPHPEKPTPTADSHALGRALAAVAFDDTVNAGRFGWQR